MNNNISFFSSVICHVVGITYQTIEHRLLAEMLGDPLGKNFNPSVEKHKPASELKLNL